MAQYEVWVPAVPLYVEEQRYEGIYQCHGMGARSGVLFSQQGHKEAVIVMDSAGEEQGGRNPSS